MKTRRHSGSSNIGARSRIAWDTTSEIAKPSAA
jgi:hypothetical protein